VQGHRATAAVRPTPAWVRARHSVQLPAFWLLVGLLLMGAWQLAGALRTGAAAYPLATTVAVLLFAAYTVPFVLVVRSLDYFEREPPHLVLAAFGWGGLVATSVAVPANAAAHDLVAKLASPALAIGWGPALTGPSLEEPVKVLGVVVIVLIAGAQMNSVVDGFVYGAFVGLGFQVVEDVMYAVNAVAQAGHGDRVGPVVVVFLLRGFLSGLWSHTLFSALAGAGVGYLVLHRNRRGLGVAGAALAGAWGFHALWNSPWFADGLGYGTPGVLAGLLAKGVPALLVVLTLVRSAGRREAGYYLRRLVGEPLVATERELAALASGGTRLAARRYAYRRGGRELARTVSRLQRAQARLALALSRGLPHAAEHRAEALALRRRLAAQGHPEAYAPATTRTLATAVRALGGAERADSRCAQASGAQASGAWPPSPSTTASGVPSWSRSTMVMSTAPSPFVSNWKRSALPSPSVSVAHRSALPSLLVSPTIRSWRSSPRVSTVSSLMRFSSRWGATAGSR
jgi:RsiW-degrading membrane proteinase PrsW (M82 family)